MVKPLIRLSRPVRWVLLAVAAAWAVELIASLVLSRGGFSYSLDDAYIHLALAERIIRGHYGVNLAEFSAPSSSIIWPFLLAPLTLLPGGALAPLFINLAALLATASVVTRTLAEALQESEPRLPDWAIAILALTLLLATNAIGLAFTGMEHSLQLLCAALVVLGVWRDWATGRAPWWLAAAIVGGPLLRYESLTISAVGLGWLIWRRRWGAAAGCGLAIGAALVGFSLFLRGLGLEWLPTSIMAKSSLASGGSVLRSLGSNFVSALRGKGALISAATTLAAVGAVAARDRFNRALLVMVTIATFGHLLGGSYGWYGRYETYVWLFALLGLAVAARSALRGLLAGQPIWRAGLIGIVFALGVGREYVYPTVTTPLAMNNIYEQQFQMGRFARDYWQAPVAVNDLGWVTYRNPNYVLDLGGLASLEAQRFRARPNDDGQWVGDLAARQGVRFAMIYREWFPIVPANWTPVAELRFSRPNITPPSKTVVFYALDAEAAVRARGLAAAFAPTLPPGTSLVVLP